MTLTATANPAPSSPDSLSIVDETPRPAHVMVIMMENESTGGVIGNSSLPYINNTLAADYPQLTQNYAVAHPSLPNYLELLSGSTQGVTTRLRAWARAARGPANLANQLDNAGISWSGYMENIPSAGTRGVTPAARTVTAIRSTSSTTTRSSTSPTWPATWPRTSSHCRAWSRTSTAPTPRHSCG